APCRRCCASTAAKSTANTSRTGPPKLVTFTAINASNACSWTMASGRDLTDERNARFLSLLRPVQQDCERWAYRLAGNAVDAQDILSQSIVYALSKFGQLRDDRKFKWWMFTIIRTTFGLAVRSRNRLA